MFSGHIKQWYTNSLVSEITELTCLDALVSPRNFRYENDYVLFCDIQLLRSRIACPFYIPGLHSGIVAVSMEGWGVGGDNSKKAYFGEQTKSF